MRRWLMFMAAGLIAAFGLFLVVGECFQTTDCWSGYRQIAALRGLCAAQEEFRKTDADQNGALDYWREDVAGLYTLAPAGKPLKYIDLSTAQADYAPKVPMAQQGGYGWWIGCLGFADEKSPDPQRFAYCAWPELPEYNSWVFIVSHRAIVYGKELLSPLPPGYFPVDPVADGWLTVEQIGDKRWRRRHPWGWVQFWRD